MDTRKTCCRKTLYASTEDWVVHVQGNHGDDVLKAFLAADAEDEAQKGQASSGNLEAGDQAGDKLDAVRAAATMEVAHKAMDDLKDNVHKAASDDEAKDGAKAAGDHAAKEAAAKAIHDAAKGKDTGGDAARRKAKGKADADKGKRAATTEDKGTYGGAEAGKKAKTASLFTPARIEKLAKMEERQKKKEEEKDAEESGEEEADPEGGEEEEDDQVLLYQFGIVHSDPNDDFSDCKLELTPSSTASDAADKDEDGGEEVNNIFYHPDRTPSP